MNLRNIINPGAAILDALIRRPYFLSSHQGPMRRLGCFTKSSIDRGKRKRLQQIQKMSRVKNRAR